MGRGLEVRYLSHGVGTSQFAEPGDRVKVHVLGRTLDGKVFWNRQSVPLWFTVGEGEVPLGLDEGIQRLSVAQRAYFVCTSDYAASSGGVEVPPSEPVVFDVELLEIVSWAQEGKEVFRMRATGPGTCVSSLIPVDGSCSSCSLQALFPDLEAGRGRGAAAAGLAGQGSDSVCSATCYPATP